MKKTIKKVNIVKKKRSKPRKMMSSLYLYDAFDIHK